MSIDDIENIIKEYYEIERKEIKEIRSALSYILRTYYSLPKPKPYRHTFLDIIQKSNNENLISDYLAFLLNPNLNGIGDYLIKSIISYTYPDAESGMYDFSDVEITREYAFDDSTRIDILIRSESENVIIGIENKIYDHEHSKQTYNYQKQIELKFEGSDVYLIFLAPYQAEELSSDKFIWLTYKELYSLLSKINMDTFTEFDHLKFYQDFSLHIKNNFMDSIAEIKISEKTKLYVEHKTIIDDLVNSYKQDCDAIRIFAKQIADGFFSEQWGAIVSPWGSGVWQAVCKQEWYVKNVYSHFEWWWHHSGGNMLESKELSFMFDVEGKKAQEILADIELDESFKLITNKSGAEYRPKWRKHAIYYRKVNLPNSIIEMSPKELKQVFLDEMQRFSDTNIAEKFDQVILKYR